MDPLPRHLSPVVVHRYRLRTGKRKPIRTICEVLRELHRDAERRGDTLAMVKLEEAHDMAKRMQNKLAEYGGKAHDPVYLAKVADNEAAWMTREEFKSYERLACDAAA